MTEIGFGGNNGSAFDGEGAWLRSSVPLPSGRAMLNGSTACLVTAIGSYVGGNGAARSISLQLGADRTGAFTIANDSHPVSFTGYKSISPKLAAGGADWFYIIHARQSVNFGRSSTSGSNGAFNSAGYGWSGILGGALRYVEAPTAPRSVTAYSAGAGAVTVSWDAPTSDGGTALTGYSLQYSTSASFTGAQTVLVDASASPYTLTGLTPGTLYYIRVSALNAVTEAANTSSAASAAVEVLILSGAKYGVDGQWKDCEVFLGVSGAWVPVSVGYGDAGQWKPLE
jgi:hypothetical protein